MTKESMHFFKKFRLTRLVRKGYKNVTIFTCPLETFQSRKQSVPNLINLQNGFAKTERATEKLKIAKKRLKRTLCYNDNVIMWYEYVIIYVCMYDMHICDIIIMYSRKSFWPWVMLLVHIFPHVESDQYLQLESQGCHLLTMI